MKLSELVAELKSLKDSVNKMSADRAQEQAHAANAPAKRVLANIQDLGAPQHVQDLPAEVRNRAPGTNFARITRAYACAEACYRGDIDLVPSIIADVYRDRPLADCVEKSMSTMVAEEGGLWVQPVYAADFIAYLRPKTVIFQLGARSYPMPGGTVKISSIDVGTSGYWVGETQAPKVSKPKTGQKVLREKFAGGKVVISNTLLKESSVEADQVLLEDLTTSLKIQIETAAFNGQGGDHTPRGLRYLCKKKALGAIPTGDVIPDLRRMLTKSNAPMLRPGICFNADLEYLFYTAKDGMGQYLFKDEMDRGQLFKMPYAVSNILQTGTDNHGKADIFMGDWSEFIVGDRGGVEVGISREASYTDENGNPQSAFENRETIIIAHIPTDFLIRHEEAMTLIDDAWTK